jgi:hypothetical protein
MDTLDDFPLLKLRLWNAADAVGSEVGIACLNASETAQVLVARLLPLGDEICVSDFLLQAVFVEFSGDDFSADVHVVDISGLLMVDLEDGPEGFVDSLAFVRLSLSWKIIGTDLKRFPAFFAFSRFYLRASSAPCSRVSPR